MKVLELLASPVWTGPAEPIASVARELLRRGHLVEIGMDTLRPGDLRERLKKMGFAIHDELGLSTKSGPLRMWTDVRRLRDVSRGFDVFHANFSHDHILALLATGKSVGRKIRVVRTIHSSRSLQARTLQGLLHRTTDGLIAVCESHARQLREKFGVALGRVRSAPGAVNASAFTPTGNDLRSELQIPPEAPVAGIVSRIKPGRGHQELALAFRQLVDSLSEARLLVVGRGEGLPALLEQVKRLGLDQRVIFAGYRTGQELAAAYRTLDLKVLLAEGNDGTCRAMLESMACGRPVIAYRFGSPAEVILHGVTGWLVDQGDKQGLTTALQQLLSDRNRCREMGAAARERVASEFTESARGKAVEEFMQEVIRLPPV
jgi:glycosyltransferase involved in cell wall biosynthesis